MQKEVYEFISEHTGDPIIEWRTCAISGEEFAIFQSDKEFYEKISPTFGEEKYLIPFPALCPEERERRRMLWRNDRKLYRRKCDFSGDIIVSIYHPSSSRTMYTQKIRRSDNWNPMNYGRDVDFSQSFTQQYHALLEEVPTIAIMNDDGLGTSENCAYCQDFAFGKNCYMTTATWLSENCLYCDCCLQAKDCVDCIMVHNNSSQVYEGYHCTNIQNCSYIAFSTDSYDCHFCHALVGCSFCFGCISLQNKQYYIFNKQYDQQSYQKEINKLIQLGREKIKVMFEQHKKQYAQEATIQRNSIESIGSNIFASTGIHIGFDVVDTEHAKYCTRINTHTKDCMDVYQSGSPVLSYENVTSDKSYHCAFVTWCWEGCKCLYYCDNCHTCENCFGCVGLRHKSYCIFNKQYTQEEYEKLVPHIIEKMIETGERGEFPHPSLSPFGYNETVAQEYYPLSQQGALARGYKRQDKEYPIDVPAGIETIQGEDLPTSIEQVDDTILSKAIICSVSGKPFRIIKAELAFYRKHGLPLPRKHPDIRHQERLVKRPGRELHLKKCDKCDIEMLSVYGEEYEGKVYCEDCYQKEIYG